MMRLFSCFNVYRIVIELNVGHDSNSAARSGADPLGTPFPQRFPVIFGMRCRSSNDRNCIDPLSKWSDLRAEWQSSVPNPPLNQIRFLSDAGERVEDERNIHCTLCLDLMSRCRNPGVCTERDRGARLSRHDDNYRQADLHAWLAANDER
jgi:hypothetical protein